MKVKSERFSLHIVAKFSCVIKTYLIHNLYLVYVVEAFVTLN